MARKGHIHTIITTNWDLFIERAMDELDVAYDDVIEFLRAQYVVAWTAPPGPPI
jgi:hypothetical protein